MYPLFAGASASVSITTAAGSASIALRAVGTEGTAEAARGGLGFAGSRAFRLVRQVAADAAPTQFESSSPAIHDELLSFVRLVHAAGNAAAGAPVQTTGGGTSSLTLTPAEDASAAASDGSDPERDATGAGKAAALTAPGSGTGAAALAPAPAAPVVREHGPGSSGALQELASEEDAFRISAVEAVRDLAVVAALLRSAEQGGSRVAVRQF